MTFPNDYSTYDAITIDHTRIASGGVDDMDIWLPLSLLTATANASLKSDGADARFTLNDGSTQLAHDVILDANQLAGFRVRLPNLSDISDTVIRCWYNGVDDLQSVGSLYGQHATYANSVAAYWPMNNDPNLDAIDAMIDRTVNAYHGTPAGSMTSANRMDGKVNQCLSFDGSDDLVAISNSIITGSTVAIELWYKLLGSTSCKLFEHNSPAGYFKLGVTSGIVDFNVVSSYGDQSISSMPRDNTQWTHLLAVASEGNHMTLWINGSMIDSDECGNFSAISAFGSAIGSDRRGTYSHTNGLIDEVRITHADLGPAYAITRYNNESNPTSFYKDVTASSTSTQPANGTTRKYAVIGSSLIRAAHC